VGATYTVELSAGET
jgi:hypothetical protein